VTHLRAYRYRVYPDIAQHALFRRTGGCTRFLRNLAHEQWERFDRTNRRVSYGMQAAELKALKEEAPFLKEVPHHCLQQALLDLRNAIERWRRGLAGRPRYKGRYAGDSFRFPDPTQFTVLALGIKLPKAGLVPWIMHRPIPAEAVPKSVTIVRDGEHWYACVVCELPEALPAPQPLASPVDVDGLIVLSSDIGVDVPLAYSDGTVGMLPQVTPRQAERQRRLQRQIARCRKGSRRRDKARRALARHAAARARRRRDAAHRETHRALQRCDVLALEALPVKNMTASARGTVDEPGRNVRQKAGLNRSVLDIAPGQLRRVAQWQAAKVGKRVVLVDPRNTSRECPTCGHVAESNRPRRDLFRCERCGFTGHADHVAAENIRRRAIAILREHASNPAGDRPAGRRTSGRSPRSPLPSARRRTGKAPEQAASAAQA
jgi:putative transposase